MKYPFLFFVPILLLVSGCQNCNERLDQLDSLKKNFLNAVFESQILEGPFNLEYKLRTVFLSKDIVSLFGEFNEYTRLPHKCTHYEGRTYCKINGQFKEITLDDLFSTPQQKEFLRSYCEKKLKSQQNTYFSGKKPFRSRLEQNDIHTFIVDDQFLILLFQPDVVGECKEGLFSVRIRYERLKNEWNAVNALSPILDKVIASQSFLASWDEDDFFPNTEEELN